MSGAFRASYKCNRRDNLSRARDSRGLRGQERGGRATRRGEREAATILSFCSIDAIERRLSPPLSNSQSKKNRRAHLPNPAAFSRDREISTGAERAGLQAIILEGQRGGTRAKKN